MCSDHPESKLRTSNAKMNGSRSRLNAKVTTAHAFVGTLNTNKKQVGIRFRCEIAEMQNSKRNAALLGTSPPNRRQRKCQVEFTLKEEDKIQLSTRQLL